MINNFKDFSFEKIKFDTRHWRQPISIQEFEDNQFRYKNLKTNFSRYPVKDIEFWQTVLKTQVSTRVELAQFFFKRKLLI